MNNSSSGTQKAHTQALSDSPGHSRAIRALKAAFPLTLPVLAGFLFMGMAYGILMSSIGLGAGWTFLTSWMVLAGSMQFVAINLFTAAFNPIAALTMTLMVNARHIFYGLSMLDKLKDAGRYKYYIVFALCDETFSILSSNDPPADCDRSLFMFFVALLDRWYWIIGSVLGAVLGNIIPVSTKGLDFALTALFVVIFLNNWAEKKNRISSAIGVACSIICLVLFKSGFIIPAMILILIVFALTSKKLTVISGDADKKEGILK